MFVAPSVEGLLIANAIAEDLQYVADIIIWDEGVFPLSGRTLAVCDTAADNADFEEVVITADDVTIKRGQEYPSPRDNVLFELGLFMGRLGVDHTFMVYGRDEPPSLPTDLVGVTAATYAERSDNNIDAEVGPASKALSPARAVPWRNTWLKALVTHSSYERGLGLALKTSEPKVWLLSSTTDRLIPGPNTLLR